MRILLHEFVTGGGWYQHTGGPPPPSLAAEGRAMLAAMATDLAAAGIALDVLGDVRCPDMALPGCTIHEITSAAEEQHTLLRLAAEADWTLLIAPEFQGHLLTRCRAVEAAGGRLLGPSSSCVALATDKHALCEHLARHDINVPRGLALDPGEPLPSDFPYPAVLKPRDGAGSLGVERVDSWSVARLSGPSPARLEAFCPGQPTSVAVLCGPSHSVTLPPCFQSLGGESGFSYLGGSLPIPDDLAARAANLAGRAVASLPRPLGYLGVDLVLGDEKFGAGDVVIEINPRLTTSYIGLRALFAGNLAAAMLAIASGQSPGLCWKPGPIAFEASGKTWSGGGTERVAGR